MSLCHTFRNSRCVLVTQDSWNFFKYPLSNHISFQGASPELMTGLAYLGTATPSKWAGFVGLSAFASFAEDGSSVGTPVFPFQLVFYPNERLRSGFPDSGPSRDLFSTQLSNLQPGQHLYSIYAIDTPFAAEVLVGEIVIVSQFQPSGFGDGVLFMQHTRFDDDASLRPDFTSGCPDMQTCLVCPVDEACRSICTGAYCSGGN